MPCLVLVVRFGFIDNLICVFNVSQIVYFGGLEQIIPSYYDDFPDGVVLVVRNYGVCKEWKKEFVSKRGAENGSMIFIKPGECLTVAPENGIDRQHWQIIPQQCWMEKLYPFKKHCYLHKSQYEILKGINYPPQYANYKYIRWLYMTLHADMRNELNRNQKGGCGLIHVCPDINCTKLGCYDHLVMNDPNYNFGNLKFKLVCKCGYGLGWKDKIGLKSCFQGAIGSFLCSASSMPTFSLNGVKFLRENLCKD